MKLFEGIIFSLSQIDKEEKVKNKITSGKIKKRNKKISRGSIR
jgi:hypothetical protein